MNLKFYLPVLALIASCSAAPTESSAPEATAEQIMRVEPPCWWTGMKTDLQLLVSGPQISDYDVYVVGAKGVSTKSIHKADNANYLFVDLAVAPTAAAGTYYLVFDNGQTSFKYPYQIGKRAEGSALRKSFTTADLIYLIMPDRFANGDPSNDTIDGMPDKADTNALFGRHGGDIQGIIDHIDYIADLGATAIWTTPMLEDNDAEGSYHGYAASDYYNIDRRFGSNELYCKMVEEAHANGIKVIMDIVPNHCGLPHWWIDNPPMEDWYHKFPEYTGTNATFSTCMDINGSQYDLNLMESGWFVPGMPDMNLDNPFTLKYFQQWAIWWIEYAGLDGFRVDTYPYNEKEPMSRWCKAVTDEYPNFNIVGECWTSSIPQLAYWQKDNANKDGFNSNLPSIMDFPLYEAVGQAFNTDARNWNQGLTKIYDIISHDFVYQDLNNMMTFLGNHDTERIADVLGKDPRKFKQAIALLATVRGFPQIFAGDEMMFVSKDLSAGHGGLRVDFPGGWPNDAENLFTAQGRAASLHATDGSLVPAGFNAEMHDYCRTLFQWRKEKQVIHNGKTMQFLSRDNTYAYFRYNDTEAVFVFLNNNAEPFNVPWSHYGEIASNLRGGRNVITGESVDTESLVAAPYSAIVIEFNR